MTSSFTDDSNNTTSNAITKETKQYDNLTIWLEMLRPFAFTASFVPVTVGAVLAYHEQAFSWILYVLVLFFVLLLHSAGNIANEYYDVMRGVDTSSSENASKVLLENRLPRELAIKVAIAGMVLFFAASLVFAVILGNWGIVGFAFVAVFCAYFYTAPPLQLKYVGLGPFCIFLSFGLVLTQAAYYTFVGSMSSNVLWLSLPISFLVVAILQGNDLRDIESDVGIFTLSIIVGRKKGTYIYLLIVITAYILAAINITFNMISIWGALVFFTVPLAFKTIRKSLAGLKGTPAALSRLDIETAKLHLVFGIFWIIGLLLT